MLVLVQSNKNWLFWQLLFRSKSKSVAFLKLLKHYLRKKGAKLHFRVRMVMEVDRVEGLHGRDNFNFSPSRSKRPIFFETLIFSQENVFTIRQSRKEFSSIITCPIGPSFIDLIQVVRVSVKFFGWCFLWFSSQKIWLVPGTGKMFFLVLWCCSLKLFYKVAVF